MKPINWDEIDEGSGGGFADLPSGGYVLKVTEVVDEDDYTNSWGDTYDRVVIRYDVAEGQHADFFAKNKRPDFTHEHEFRYNPDNCGDKYAWSVEQFKSFWNTILPGSNAGWAFDFNPQSMVGKLFGATLRHRYYTKSSGEDGSAIQIQGLYTADRIREGKFKAPADIDRRDKKAVSPAPAKSAYSDDELPF